MDEAREVAWALTRVGYRRDQIDGEFSGLVDEVDRARSALFPRRLGYTTSVHPLTCDASQLPTSAGAVWTGVLWTIDRGDFHGEIRVSCEWGDSEDRAGRAHSVVIRAQSTSVSQRFALVRTSGERMVQRASRAAAGSGAAIGLAMCWAAAGLQNPIVGGMMLFVLMASLTVGGASIGARVGEELVGRRELLALAEGRRDVGLQADIKRWKQLTRQLRGQRRVLARGISGAPFRRVPALVG